MPPHTASTTTATDLWDDGDLVVEAERQLRASSFSAVRALKCDCVDGVLTVAGRVPSFFSRQVALTMLRHMAGVARVDDRIEVDRN